jgi:flagellar capping protein FliD
MESIVNQMQALIMSQSRTIEELKAEIEFLKGPKPKKPLSPQQQALKEIKDAEKEFKKAEAAIAKQLKKAETDRNKVLEKALKARKNSEKETSALSKKLTVTDVFVDASE